MPPPAPNLHRNNAAEWVMWAIVVPLSWIWRNIRRNKLSR